MADVTKINAGDEVIGADGVHVGTVDAVDGGRLKLAPRDSVDGKTRFIDGGLIADLEDGKVRLAANADVAITLEDEDPSESDRLDEGLEETFPASDPVSAKHIT